MSYSICIEVEEDPSEQWRSQKACRLEHLSSKTLELENCSESAEMHMKGQIPNFPLARLQPTRMCGIDYIWHEEKTFPGSF